MIDLIDIVIGEVGKVTGVSVSDILGDSKMTDIVDARYITVYHCVMLGVSTDRLALRFGRTRKSVISRMFTQYSTRRSTEFRLKSDMVKLAVCKIISDIDNDTTSQIGEIYQHAIFTQDTRLVEFIGEERRYFCNR